MSEKANLSPGEKIDLMRFVIERGEAVDVEAEGHCMRPWIFAGDHLKVAALSAPPRRGMVVLVQIDSRTFAHRVVDVGPDGRVLTRGDLLPHADPWRSASDLIGQVTEVRNRLGWTVPLDLRPVCLAGWLLARPLRLGYEVVRKVLGR